MSTSRIFANVIFLLAVAGLAFYLGRITSAGVEIEPDPTDPGELVLEKATPYNLATGVDKFREYKTQVDASLATSPMRLYSAYDIIQLSDLNAIISQLRLAGKNPDKLVIRKGTNPDASNPNFSTYFYFLDDTGALLNLQQDYFYNDLQRCPKNCNPIFDEDFKDGDDFAAPGPIN